MARSSFMPCRSASKLLRVRCGGRCADRGPLAKVPTACGASQTTLEGSAGLASCLWETSGRSPIGWPHSVPSSVARGGGSPSPLPQFPRSHPLAPFTASVVQGQHLAAARWRHVLGGLRPLGAARPRREEFGFCDQARARGGGALAGVLTCKSGEPWRR